MTPIPFFGSLAIRSIYRQPPVPCVVTVKKRTAPIKPISSASRAAIPPPLPPTVEGATATPVPTPDIQNVPVAPAPSNLAGIALPASQEEVVALFRNLPPSVAGQDRVITMSNLRTGHLEVVYGNISLSGTEQSMPRIMLIGMDQALEPSTPGWTGAHVIAFTARQSPDRITAWGRDGHLYWIRVAGPVDPQHTNPNQMLLIGTDTSTWVFQLIATAPEELDALGEALAKAR